MCVVRCQTAFFRMCKQMLHVARFLPHTYCSYTRPVWKKLPSYLENVLEKVVFPNRPFFALSPSFFFFFTAEHCSRGMWKMVCPRWLAVNVPYRRKFPLQRFQWFVHSLFQHKSKANISPTDASGAKIEMAKLSVSWVGNCVMFTLLKMARPDVKWNMTVGSVCESNGELT